MPQRNIQVQESALWAHQRPATLQRTIGIILARFKCQSCLVHVDDIVVFLSTFEEHFSHVAALSAARISLKLRMCVFFDSSVNYLRHTNPGALKWPTGTRKQPRDRRPDVPNGVALLHRSLQCIPAVRSQLRPSCRALDGALHQEIRAKLPQFDDRRMEAFNLLKKGGSGPAGSSPTAARPPVLRRQRSVLASAGMRPISDA